MRPQLSWVPAFIPRVLFAGILICLAVPATVNAAGINLSWDECGAAGAEIKTFACDSGQGAPFTLVASFRPPAGVTKYLGLSADFRIAGQTLPDWWKHGDGLCRGKNGLSVSFEAPGEACTDYWQGQAAGGFLYQIEHAGPTAALLRVQAALPFEAAGPLEADREYYAFSVRFQRSPTSGCSGCNSPIGIALDHIKLFQPPELRNDPMMTTPISRNVAYWQGVIAQPTITRVAPLRGGAGTLVRIEGTRLGSATSVRFGGVEGSFQIQSDGLVEAQVPVNARSGPISVVTAEGTAMSSQSFQAPPVVLSFEPQLAPSGTEITIHGYNFESATDVQFHGVSATFTFAADSRIVATVPVGATTGPITVTNFAGSTPSSTSFIVVGTGAPPALTSFEPQAGPTGSTVVILGSGLGQMGSVHFGGVEGQAVAVSDTRIDAVVPPLARSGFITVATGLGTAVSTSSFTAQPVISSFAPQAARPSSQVQIHGFNFAGATTVRIGGVTAVFGVISDILILAAIPATAVAGPIEVENAAGTTISTAVLRIGLAPTLVSFAPQLGGAGTTVVIEGTGFSEVEAVRFGGVAAGFTVVSVSRIEATVPPLAYSGPIEVKNVFGSVMTSTPFMAPPVIREFNPVSASAGAEIQVFGFNFEGVTGVRIGGVTAIFSVLYDGALTSWVPIGAVTGTIEVENPAGAGASGSVLQVGPEPNLNSFAPTSGASGTTVTLEGSGFVEVRSVRFGGVGAAFTVVSESRIETVVPPDVRSGPIAVTTLFGTATSIQSFTAPPVVTGFVPAYAQTGTEIEIRGYNFAGATEVRFNGVPAAFAFISGEAIRATVPNSATSGPVSVANAAGTGTSSQVFLVGEFLDGGINLAWNDCGTAGTSVQSFACDTNAGDPFSLVASFAPPPGMVEFLGLSATLRITGDELPDWWQFGSGSCRGFNGLATSFDGWGVACEDFWHGAAAGGFAYDVTWGDLTTSRLRVQMAVPFENRGPVNADLEYYAFKVRLMRSKSVGSGACSGCDVSRQITLDEIQLFQPPEQGNDPVLTAPLHSAVALWQPPVLVPPEISLFEPTRDLPGRPVSIAGRYLTGATSVRFGGVESEFQVASDEHIIATVPAAAADAPITVVTPGGAATSADVFQVGAPSALQGPNLVADPSFERSTDGWRPSNCTVDRIPAARTGSHALRLLGSTTIRRFDLHDTPNHVRSTAKAGSVHKFSAWVKSRTGGVTVRLRVKEYQDTTHVQTASTSDIAVGSLWQRITCDVTSQFAASSLDFQFLCHPSIPAAEVLIEDVAIREQGASPTVTAPALVEAMAGTPVEIEVAASATGAIPLVSLGADLSGLPLLSDATFTADPDFTRGVLRWTPQVEDAAWDHSVTFRARSEVEALASTVVRVAPAPPDPRRLLIDFDSPDLSHWRAHRGATFEHVTPGRLMSPGAVLAHSPSPHTTFGIKDSPNWVAYTGTQAGERFRISCWMRKVSGEGEGLLRVVEYLQGAKVGSTTVSQEIPLTDAWQQIVVERVSEAAGSSFDIKVECDPSTEGTSFLIDDLSIRFPSTVPAAERFAAGGDYAPIRPTLFPNPVRERATLSWTLASAGLVQVGIFDVNGRRVRSLLHDPEAQPGTHHLLVERRDARGEPIAAGVYFYRIDSVDGVRQGRFVVLD